MNAGKTKRNMLCLPRLLALVYSVGFAAVGRADPLEKDFAIPPDAARPGVYWCFMDGNLRRKSRVIQSIKEETKT